VHSRRERARFVKFPWQVYRGDPLWVPPLISDQLAYFNPRKSLFFRTAEVAFFTARRGSRMVGTIAAFIDRRLVSEPGQQLGGFGFFEVLDDYPAAERLLQTAVDWHRERGSTILSGPTNFTDNESPGVLIEGAACPPVMLEAHTPPYYKDFLERFGMVKDNDYFAWRAFRSQVGESLEKMPAALLKVAEAARKSANLTIRKLRMDRFREDLDIALYLFNTTLNKLPGFHPMEKTDFHRMVATLKPFIDPDLALFAEVDGKPVGFCVAIPDMNQVLIHLNGRLLPFNWLKLPRLIRNVDAVSFKLMGVLEEYRRRGIESLLYLEAIRAFIACGYAWLDGSVTSERNTQVNLLASTHGAERYKHYRVYKLDL